MTGARVFTATSSQGLAFMHEVLFMAAALRTPMVMANVNRALSAPLNIWNDHADAMAERDAGWVQLWVSSAQEAYDTTLMAFKLSEETRLPVMVNLDGYILSHTYEPVELIAEETVRKYIPSKPLVNRLSPKTAFSVGVVGPPEYYFEMKYQAIDAIERSLMPISKITADFNRSFGRSYDDVYSYGMEDAEYALLTMGSMTGSARVVAEELRKEGLKAGVVSIRTFRPFPVERLIEKVDGLKGLGVMDRASTPGGPSNPLFSDIATCLYGLKDRPILQSFVSGLGGRDISLDNFRTMFKATKEAADAKAPKPCMYVGLRE
jgi:pyruvate ferredoxin oxidoreductase alpha subunit